MYRKQISQKASPFLRSTPTSQDITPSSSYGPLSAVVQRVQQDPNSVSKDERQQLESVIGTRSTQEILAGKQNLWVPEFQGVSAQLWGNTGQVDAPIQAKVNDDVEMSEVQPENETGLPDNLKVGIENLSGMAMDDVRVHYNSSKPAEVKALAYTQGTDIHVAPGQEQHLPHEAWHVVQQMQGRVKPTMQAKGIGINDDRGLEREADVMGAKALILNPSQYNHHDFTNDTLAPGTISSDLIQRRQWVATHAGDLAAIQNQITNYYNNCLLRNLIGNAWWQDQNNGGTGNYWLYNCGQGAGYGADWMDDPDPILDWARGQGYGVEGPTEVSRNTQYSVEYYNITALAGNRNLPIGHPDSDGRPVTFNYHLYYHNPAGKKPPKSSGKLNLGSLLEDALKNQTSSQSKQGVKGNRKKQRGITIPIYG